MFAQVHKDICTRINMRGKKERYIHLPRKDWIHALWRILTVEPFEPSPFREKGRAKHLGPGQSSGESLKMVTHRHHGMLSCCRGRHVPADMLMDAQLI